jgi:excisionase family DNA binding protein
MEEKIIEQLNRIERYSIIAAKTMITIDEAAIVTGLSKSWLYKATCNHTIPHYKPNGKTIYFDRTELDSWMKQNRISTSQEAELAANTYMMNNTGRNGHKKGGKRP